MLKLVVVGTIVSMAAASHPINSDMVKQIREKTGLWEAHDVESNPLVNYTHDQLLGMLGTYIVPSNKIYPDTPVKGDIPSEFDARTQWGAKVHPIRDQAGCGSCWAFGASESFSDRLAIVGGPNVVLSPQDMVSCDTNDYGCQGGYMDMAWEFIDKEGLVSESCFPYASQSGVSPACTDKCANGEAFTKYSCVDGSITQSKTVASIKSEILNGPVEAAFTVYEDFFSYSSGVYHHTSESVAGGHAIKLLGFGTESGQDYWLAANSWGSSWGMKGFFKILQGDCGIEEQVFSCTPQTKPMELIQ